MKNKKGFTLIEIIGTVIILGILAIITIPMFTKNLSGFREDYYFNIENTLKNSGKEFFNDNRKYRPNKYLESSKVTVATLEGKKYLDKEILDYEGNSCNKDSYVIVIRRGKDDYDYHVCLTCANDDYENVSGNKYCDSSWDIPTVDYTLGDVDTLYVYKGSDKNTLKEKTAIPLNAIKKDEYGNIIDEVNGEGDEGIEYINPINIDTINTQVVGEYPLIYEYVGSDDGDDTTEDKVTKEGKVVVYENDAPVITVTKTNNVATSRTANSNEITNYGMGGTWAQQLTVKFVRGAGKYTETGTTASKYQWKRGNKWIDFCTDLDVNANCTITIGKKVTDALGLEHDMNEDVQFRIIDTEGNISIVSPSYRFMIDNTNPSCEVTTSGTMGKNNWYTANVTVNEVNMRDQIGSVSSAVSGVKYYTLDTSQIASRTVTATTSGISHGDISGTQTSDTTSVTWYGFIEDNAQNYTVCNKTFKKDATKPYIEWNPDDEGPHNDSDGFTATGTCKDETSGTSGSTSKSIPSPTTGTSVSLSCEDNAGNTASSSRTYKVKKWFSNDCGRCGESTCTSSSCCGTETYGCDTLYCFHSSSVCGGPPDDSGTIAYYDCGTCGCSTRAKTCTSSCCGCESCWSY